MNVNIAGIAKGIVLACDAVNLLDGVGKLQESEKNRWIHAAYLIDRVVILGFTLTNLGLELRGADAKTLANVKAIEIIPRTIDLMVRVIREAALLDESELTLDTRKMARFIQKGLLAPLSDILIDAVEYEAYMDKYYLEMPPEEFEKVKHREFYDGDGNFHEYDISLEDCKRDLETAPGHLMMASIARLAFDTGGIENVASGTVSVYSFLVQYMRNFRVVVNDLEVAANQESGAPQLRNRAREVNIPNATPHRQVPARRAVASNGTQTELTDEEAGLFVGFPFIPPPLHNDALFRRYICPITCMPIRDPVGDPNTPTVLYERRAILTWLNMRKVSPIANIPLNQETLVDKPALKNAIDHRLRYHHEKMLEYMASPAYQATLNAPVEEDLERGIIHENPDVHVEEE